MCAESIWKEIEWFSVEAANHNIWCNLLKWPIACDDLFFESTLLQWFLITDPPNISLIYANTYTLTYTTYSYIDEIASLQISTAQFYQHVKWEMDSWFSACIKWIFNLILRCFTSFKHNRLRCVYVYTWAFCVCFSVNWSWQSSDRTSKTELPLHRKIVAARCNVISWFYMAFASSLFLYWRLSLLRVYSQ